MTRWRETARAKVNLTLRVRGRRGDGYHELVSLVAFADIGDVLELEPDRPLSLEVAGPFAGAIGGGNLVLRAAEAAAGLRPGLRSGAFRLDKRLPVAAGLGGGSADAAAVLRLLMRANPELGQEEVARLCPALGADVPVCFLSRAALVAGIGEIVRPLGGLPPLHAVLVNPDVPLPTSGVFAALDAPAIGSSLGANQPPPGPFADADALVAFLAGEGNDLEAPAMRLAPAVAEVLSALRRVAGCRLARMSGSGATCFGVFDSEARAERAAREIAVAHPGWWALAASLG